MTSDQVLENYSSLVDTFLEFLTVAIHLILYERAIYPQRSFLKARKYNHAVRQNRHPTVCKFIDDAVAAVRVQLMKCAVSSVSLILVSPAQIPLERYVFSTELFPTVGPGEQYIPFLLAPRESEITNETSNTSASRLSSTHTPISDLHAQYMAVLARLGTLASSLQPLPAESSFTLAIELRETPRGEPPIGWPMPFVPAEPGLQRKMPPENDEAVIWTVARLDDENSEPGPTQETSSGLWNSSGDVESDKSKDRDKDAGERKGKADSGMTDHGPDKTRGGKSDGASDRSRRRKGEYLEGTKTVPIRNVEAGPFVMEVWVEQNDAQVPQQGSEHKNPSAEDGQE